MSTIGKRNRVQHCMLNLLGIARTILSLSIGHTSYSSSCLSKTPSLWSIQSSSPPLIHSPMIHDVMVREEGTVIRDLPRNLPVVRGGEMDTSAGLQP